MTIEDAVRSNSLTAEHIATLKERARFVRTETVRLISIAKVGHYSSVFSCASRTACGRSMKRAGILWACAKLIACHSGEKVVKG